MAMMVTITQVEGTKVAKPALPHTLAEVEVVAERKAVGGVQVVVGTLEIRMAVVVVQALRS